MGMSFQEKSLWLMFASLIVVFLAYFGAVLPSSAVDVMPQQISLFVMAVLALVVLQVVGHILIALLDRRTDTDERDQLIALKGSRNAGYMLATGVFTALCTALLTHGNFLVTHVLLAFWVAAQLVEIGSQLLLYRRGA
ncbi:MAG: hypothetical protein V4582_13330 [Pseudomonadota bacterium]